MSKLDKKYNGAKKGNRWFRYNQKPTPGGPICTDIDNLQSLHIINPSEDKGV